MIEKIHESELDFLTRVGRRMMMEEKKLKITLVRSTIGAVPKNKAIVESMGLRKIGRSVILPDNDATRGQIRKVSHLLKVEEA